MGFRKIRRVQVQENNFQIQQALDRMRAEINIPPPEDGVYAYISTPAPTTCVVAGDWYFIEGVFTNEVLKCWEIAPPLTYLGCDDDSPHKFKVHVCASFASDTGLNLVKMALFKNGVLQTNSIMSEHIQTTAQERAMATVDVIEFDVGDTVDIRMSSSQAGAEVTAVNLTTCLSRFF
jgi:hypothetical protein